MLQESLSRSNWDDDDDLDQTPRRSSTWDHPTPKLYGSGGSSRDPSSARSEFTPFHKLNSWSKDKGRSSGATPQLNDEEERQQWEEEQQRLERVRCMFQHNICNLAITLFFF